MQTEFQARPLPGQMPLSSSTIDQPHQGRDPQVTDSSVSHLPLRRGGKWAPSADSWGRARFAFVVSGRSQATPNWFLPLNIADFRPSSLVDPGGGVIPINQLVPLLPEHPAVSPIPGVGVVGPYSTAEAQPCTPGSEGSC